MEHLHSKHIDDSNIWDKETAPGLFRVRDLIRYQMGNTGHLEPVWGEEVGVYNANDGNLTSLNLIDRVKLPRVGSEEYSFTDETEGLDIYLQTSTACNMACPDCAVGLDVNNKLVKWMNLEVLRNALTSSAESAVQTGKRYLKVKYAGGESTLKKAFDLITDGQAVIADIQKSYPQLEINQVLLTNGTLLDDAKIAKIKEWKMRVSCSIWGIGDINDRERNSKVPGSYSKATEALRKMFESGINFSIHHVISPTNAKYLADFLRTFGDSESSDYVARDWDWGKYSKQPLPVTLQLKRPHSLKQLTEFNSKSEETISGIRGGMNTALNLLSQGRFINYFHRFDYLRPFDVVLTACGSGFNYIAVGPGGEIAGCHEALRYTSAHINQLSNLVSVLDLANRKYVGQQHKLIGVGLDYGHVDDNLHVVLMLHGGGGCKLLSALEHGGQQGFSSNYTQEIYQELLPDIL